MLPKICVYTIAKNEEKFAQRFCESTADADLIVIGDTGSTDQTAEIARRYGARVYDITISPWRFDKARDAVLALVPPDITICISIDLDEVLEPGWRQEIERVWKPETTRLRYGYDWGQGIRFQAEKIHHRHGYHWHHPCHEYPRPDGRIREVWAETDQLLVSHYPDPTKSRGSYLELLELSVQEDPHCPRNAFYYARELTFHRQWAKSIPALTSYLNNPNATWNDERCYAMRLLARAHQHLGDVASARQWLEQATTLCADLREPWVDLAELHYHQHRWQDSLDCARRALAITDQRQVYTRDPTAWGARPYDLAAIAAWNLMDPILAAKYGAQAVELDPTNERLIKNLQYYRSP